MKAASSLVTARLELPPWTDADAGLMVELSADPRIMRFIGTGAVRSAEESRAVSARVVEHWRASGFGWRAAVERDTGRPVGLISLNFLQAGTAGLSEGEFEIGWWVRPDDWGRGLATEGALAVCADAFSRVGAPSLVARLQPANVASARVAERLGMTHEFDTTGPVGEDVRVYRLRAADPRAAAR